MEVVLLTGRIEVSGKALVGRMVGKKHALEKTWLACREKADKVEKGYSHS